MGAIITKFSLYGLEMEAVDNFIYLGIISSKTGNFNLAKNKRKKKEEKKERKLPKRVLRPCVNF